VKAVDGVSFTLMPGETLGIVGESGSGKSMTALSLMRLVPEPAGRIVEGKILFQGEDLVQKTQAEMRDMRGRDICMILQDPMTSLNPVFTIGNQVIETVRQGEHQSNSGLKARAIELLQKVKIASPDTRMNAYPHQMSGGMRQRVVGAIAIAGAPKVLIADEATTSLDATIQYQYLTLLKELQAETGMSIIFITHDFGIVAKMCDRVAVMYAGRIAENSDVRDLFNHPAHPYTEALMRSVPNVDEEVDHLYSIEGQPPALDNLPPGCTFAPRCPYVFERCNEAFPDLFQVGNGHFATCWKLAGK
jgi:oligopeptide/dipeptide ABC transporter ATP-binding protein